MKKFFELYFLFIVSLIFSGQIYCQTPDIGSIKQYQSIKKFDPNQTNKDIATLPRPDMSVIGNAPKIVQGNSLSEKSAVDKIVFIKRRPYVSSHNYTNFYDGINPKEGGALCILDLKTKQVKNLIPSMSDGTYDSFDISFDAKKIVFAYKKPTYKNGFLLYEVDIDGNNLKQLTFPAADEEEWAKWSKTRFKYATNDMQPCYLPNGAIMFSSNRNHLSVLCDAGSNIEVSTLFRLEPDGKIERVTHSPLSEFYPVLLDDGRVMYHRWEYVDKGAGNVKCLWSMRPDGSGSSEIYGNNIVLARTIAYGRPIPNRNDKFVALATPHFTLPDIGTVILIDTSKDIRTNEPMKFITPWTDCRQHAALEYFHKDSKKWKSYTWNKRNQYDPKNPAYIYRDPYPLSEELFLVAFNNGKYWSDDTAFGIYFLDDKASHQEVYSDEVYSCFSPIPLVERKVPTTTKTSINEELAAQKLATVFISDVYFGLENVERGRAKYIRVMEQLARPLKLKNYDSSERAGLTNTVIADKLSLTPKYSLGIAPVYQDGSASFYVPADKNIYFQLLDENYMLIQTERTYVNYIAGETRSCIGCHEKPNDAPVQAWQKKIALRKTPDKLSAQLGDSSVKRVFDYERQVQPVWDKHCVSCHNSNSTSPKPDLSGTQTNLYNISYENLRKYVVWSQENHESTAGEYLPAYSLGSHPSKLIGQIIKGCPKQKSKPDFKEFVRVVSWLDTGALYYPSWHGLRNIKHKEKPNYRPLHDYESATKFNP